MLLGNVYCTLGSVFKQKGFQKTGYVILILGGLGLLFMTDHLLFYTAIVYGIGMIIIGLLLHGKHKQMSEKHTTVEESND